MNITTLNPVTLWEFLDVNFNGNKVVFSKNGKTIGECENTGRTYPRTITVKGLVTKINETEVNVELVSYADLHRHSGYSLLDGAISIKKMVEKTEFVGALTDHGCMYGLIDYYKQMLKNNKKPILGFEAYCETINGEKNGNHLLLLAKNIEGFHNLIKLSSEAYNNFYKHPHISYEMLEKYSKGIIATSACIGGEIPQLLINDKYDEAVIATKKLMSLFDKGDFYFEVQRHNLKNEAKANNELIKLAKELNIKIIATTDSHYVNKEDSYEHEILLCIGTQSKITDEKRMKFEGSGYHLHSSKEMEELFIDMPEALSNTLEIAEKCNVTLDLKSVYMPEFAVPTPFKDEQEYFEHLSRTGLKKRFGEDFDNQEYIDRLEFEIGVIRRMKFPGYFLIVADFVNFAKNAGIAVGPGRGSAAGSLVAYCMGITEIDPIKYGLLFERFLNVDRVSMPDIDLDFDDTRREEVIDYVKEKYGANAVSRIITFGTLSAKAVIKDVARVLDFPYAFGDKISKTITDAKMTIGQNLEENIEFKSLYNSDDDVKRVVDIAKKLEGLPRNASQHACGVIVAPSEVTDYIPQIMMKSSDGIYEPTTQFIMTECEECGLLKIDFLGLRTMGVVDKCLKDVNKRRKIEGLPELDYSTIPIDDPAVYEFISDGNTQNVFQLESPGMTSFMKELFQDAYKGKKMSEKEKKKFGLELFERVIAGISLYRPGPIDEIPNYIHNMLHPEDISYENEKLEPILSNTYSVIVYQEQVMFIVRELAGFTKGQSDTIRKAMGKKKKEIIDEYEEYFIYGSKNYDKTHKGEELGIIGCVNNGIPESVAKDIWNKMKKFALYAFNKSHSTGYADIAVKTAWLSCYYPVEYMCATLNSFITKADKLKSYLAACKAKGVEVLQPDVNKSDFAFSVENGCIRFGLMGLKGLGAASEHIVEERTKNGEFSSIQDFTERMAVSSRIDKKIFEALVYSSATDSFGHTRNGKILAMNALINAGSEKKLNLESGQMSIFDIVDNSAMYDVTIPQVDEFETSFKLQKEKEFSGFYITEHPLDSYSQITENPKVVKISELLEEENVGDEDVPIFAENKYEGKSVRICGIVQDVQMKLTKNGNRLCTFNIEDKTGTMKCTVFSKTLENPENFGVFEENNICFILAKIKTDDFGTQGIVEKIKKL